MESQFYFLYCRRTHINKNSMLFRLYYSDVLCRYFLYPACTEAVNIIAYTVKKRLAIFLSPVGMSLTKLSLAENNLFFSGQGEFGS